MSGLNQLPAKKSYGKNCTVGSNPTLSANFRELNMKYLIKVIEQGCGFKTIIECYTRSFRSENDLDGFLITEEEYQNDGRILKRQVIAEPLEK